MTPDASAYADGMARPQTRATSVAGSWWIPRSPTSIRALVKYSGGTGRLELDAHSVTFAPNVRWWPKSIQGPAGRIAIPVVLPFDQIRETELKIGRWFTTMRF